MLMKVSPILIFFGVVILAVGYAVCWVIVDDAVHPLSFQIQYPKCAPVGYGIERSQDGKWRYTWPYRVYGKITILGSCAYDTKEKAIRMAWVMREYDRTSAPERTWIPDSPCGS